MQTVKDIRKPAQNLIVTCRREIIKFWPNLSFLKRFSFKVTNRTNYSGMGQLKLMEGSLYLSRPYSFKFFKGCLPQILLGPFLNALSQIAYDTLKIPLTILINGWNFSNIKHFLGEISKFSMFKRCSSSWVLLKQLCNKFTCINQSYYFPFKIRIASVKWCSSIALRNPFLFFDYLNSSVRIVIVWYIWQENLT